MVSTTFVDVDLASTFKKTISFGNVLFDDGSLRKFIMDSDDDTMLMITKSIGSDVTFVDAKIVDDSLIKKILC